VSAERVIGALLLIARDDLEAAEVLQAAANRNAAYHLEQAAEKIIKAILTSEGQHAGIGHQLDAMVRALPDEHPMKKSLGDLVELQAFATTFRYGTPVGRVQPPLPATDYARLSGQVRAALGAVLSGFDVDLVAKEPRARRPRPLR
jgi:HEPN domain-containing protein